MQEELKKEIARGREEITRTILLEARRIIPQYGIELVDVRIKRLNYVESVQEKVYARMISERKRIAAQFRSEGEGRSAEILGTMEKELARSGPTPIDRFRRSAGKVTPRPRAYMEKPMAPIPSSTPSRAPWRPTRKGRTKIR